MFLWVPTKQSELPEGTDLSLVARRHRSSESSQTLNWLQRSESDEQLHLSFGAFFVVVFLLSDNVLFNVLFNVLCPSPAVIYRPFGCTCHLTLLFVLFETRLLISKIILDIISTVCPADLYCTAWFQYHLKHSWQPRLYLTDFIFYFKIMCILYSKYLLLN